MSLKFKIGLLVGVFLITAFAFAENGGQLPVANVSVAAGQPAAAAALPETPAKQAEPWPPPPGAYPPPAKLGFFFGFDERVRGDAYNNADASAASHDENRFVRMRTRAFLGVTIGENVDAYFREANESWKRFYASSSALGTTKSLSLPWLAGEFWIDNAYINFKKLPMVSNTSLKIGRFDLIRNEGFGFFTGSEGVGPRDAFVPAGLDLAYTRGKQKFELMAFYSGKTDFLPVINGYNQALNDPAASAKLAKIRETLNESDISSATVYYTNRMFKNTDIDVYDTFFHEYDMSCGALNATGGCSYYSDSGLAYSSTNYWFYQPDRRFDMLAGRIVQRFPSQHIVIKEEFQGEVGNQNGVPLAIKNIGGVAPLRGEMNIRAYGSYGYATKYFQVNTKPYLRFVYVFLSGGKPGNLKTDGNYDNPYNRWAWHPSLPDPDGYQTPLFSDLYVYSQQKTEFQSNPAYMTNLRILGAEGGFTPFKKAWLIGAYQNVGAINPYAPNPIWGATAMASTLPFYNPAYSAAACTPNAAGIAPLAQCSVVGGTTRYQLIKAEFKYILNSRFNFYISPEKDYFGDYYNSSHHANGYYFRSELNYTFSSFIPFQKTKTAKASTPDSGI